MPKKSSVPSKGKTGDTLAVKDFDYNKAAEKQLSATMMKFAQNSGGILGGATNGQNITDMILKKGMTKKQA